MWPPMAGRPLHSQPDAEHLHMTKQEQFLIVVQTVVLADVIGTGAGDGAKYAAYSYMAMALHASERIPHELEPAEAAEEFCRWQLDDGDKPDWL